MKIIMRFIHIIQEIHYLRVQLSNEPITWGEILKSFSTHK